MKTKLVVQVKLRSPNHEDGSFTERTCYVEARPFRVGDRITLLTSEDPGREWEVIWKAGSPVEAAGIRTDWEIGGIRGVSR